MNLREVLIRCAECFRHYRIRVDQPKDATVECPDCGKVLVTFWEQGAMHTKCMVYLLSDELSTEGI